MSTEIVVSGPSRPPTSHQMSNAIPLKRSLEDSFHPMLPLSDYNTWYYPSHGHDSDEDEGNVCKGTGNWGNKAKKGARWAREGKLACWGPGIDDWEAEQRARKKMKLLMPQPRRSPSPPSLPHLRSPSPPIVSPYPPASTQHLNHFSFVMDKSVTHTFRSNLLNELEHMTNGLIESEATMQRALGRLWQVISEDPDKTKGVQTVITKREDEDVGEVDRLDRLPDLTPPIHKLFLVTNTGNDHTPTDPSQFASPELQLDSLEKSLAALRELQDDGREYVERLQEIRDGLGDIIAQRSGIWNIVRENAVKELQEAAFSLAV